MWVESANSRSTSSPGGCSTVHSIWKFASYAHCRDNPTTGSVLFRDSLKFIFILMFFVPSEAHPSDNINLLQRQRVTDRYPEAMVVVAPHDS